MSCAENKISVEEESSLQGKTMAFKVKSYKYNASTIPQFFLRLVQNHLVDFKRIENKVYQEHCQSNAIVNKDSTNIHHYFTLKILHDIFTSNSAVNCSKGEILNIPYQWHWVEQNPRHEIVFLENNTLLKDTNPPKNFSRYNSYADIDRTPYLYLSDLSLSTPKYYSKSCDTFSTFGWCSEREMAFVCLLELLGYSGKVVTEGNHSWSEFLVSMKINSNSAQQFLFTVDNTFQ